MTYDRLATRGWKVPSDISESRLMTRSPSLNRLKSELLYALFQQTANKAQIGSGSGPPRRPRGRSGRCLDPKSAFSTDSGRIPWTPDVSG